MIFLLQKSKYLLKSENISELFFRMGADSTAVQSFELVEGGLSEPEFHAKPLSGQKY